MAIRIILSNGRDWKTKNEAKQHFKAILHRYQNGDMIKDRQDVEDLTALLVRYDEAEVDSISKVGPGIKYFSRQLNKGAGFSTPGFWAHRTDDTETDFSYLAAIDGRPKGQSKEFYDACRAAVSDQLRQAKRQAFKEYGDQEGQIRCEITGTLVTIEAAHLDHAWPTFAQLVTGFRAARGWNRDIPEGIVTPSADGQTQSRFVDSTIKKAFQEYHQATAILRIVDSKANLSQAASQRRPTIRCPIQLDARD